LLTQRSPASAVKPAGTLDQLLSTGGLLLPPLVIGDRASVAQYLGVPVLAATDAAGARLEPTDTALHVSVGARELLTIVALHQVRPQVGEDLQELAEILPLSLAEGAIAQSGCQLLAPAIQTTAER